MTCLYECLVQIRALRDTAQRLSTLVASAAESGGGATAAELLGQRAELELAQGEWLHLLLGGAAPVVTPVAAEPTDPASAAIDRFLAARHANLALLERLGAAELERSGTLPDGRPATVTDVVAMMVAADTDAAAALRGAVPTPGREPQGEP